MKQKSKITTAWIAKVAILAALSIVLYNIKISLSPPFPSFLKLQFSNLPLVIGGFLLGPKAGMVILLIRTVVHLPTSNTQMVGELADFIIGTGYVLTTSIIYRKQKTKKGGIIALSVGLLVWILVACIANYFILIPFYIEFIMFGVEPFVEMCKVFMPQMTVDNYKIVYTLAAALPFNLVISILVTIVTFFTYKRLSFLFNKITFEKEEKEE